MRILLTNDDGIYAPGLAALEKELRNLGEVDVVAPVTEQSGVSHSITYLSPLVVTEVFEGRRRRGWTVEGSPADCIKLGIFEFCPERPDLVVSGINGGLNAGVNVFYSGTVAAAIEGALFGITSIAVSLEFDEHAEYDEAARMARRIVEGTLARQRKNTLPYNLNIPTAALRNGATLRVVPVNVDRYAEDFVKRTDPRGRDYYWARYTAPPPTADEETDLSALAKGFVTLTPLDCNLTMRSALAEMRDWDLMI